MSQLPLGKAKNAAFKLLNRLVSVLLTLVRRSCKEFKDCDFVLNNSDWSRVISDKNNQVKSELTTICKKNQNFLGCSRTGLPTLIRPDHALGGYPFNS